MKNLLTIPEVASRLGIHTSNVRWHLTSGNLTNVSTTPHRALLDSAEVDEIAPILAIASRKDRVSALAKRRHVRATALEPAEAA